MTVCCCCCCLLPRRTILLVVHSFFCFPLSSPRCDIHDWWHLQALAVRFQEAMKSLAKISGEEGKSREVEEINRHVRAVVEAVSRMQKDSPPPPPPPQPLSLPTSLRPRDVIPPAAKRDQARAKSKPEAPRSARSSSKRAAAPSSAAGVGSLEEDEARGSISQPKSQRRREQTGWVRVRVGAAHERKAWKRMYAVRMGSSLCLHREETVREEEEEEERGGEGLRRTQGEGTGAASKSVEDDQAG